MLYECFHCGTFREDPLGMAWGPPRTPDCLLGFMIKALGDWQNYPSFGGYLSVKQVGLWEYLICAGCILHRDILQLYTELQYVQIPFI